MPNGATNMAPSRMMARISVAGDPWMLSQSLKIVPMMPSPVSPASRVLASSVTYTRAPTIGPHSVAAPPSTMISRNVMLPMSVMLRMSGLARFSRIVDSEPAIAHIAAEMPNTIVFVRARGTPITAAAVSLSRIATSDRPTRLLTRPRATR